MPIAEHKRSSEVRVKGGRRPSRSDAVGALDAGWRRPDARRSVRGRDTTQSARCTEDATAHVWVHITDRLACVNRPGAPESHELRPQGRAGAPPVDWRRARAALSAAGLAGVQSLLTLALMFAIGLVVCVVSGPYDDLLTVVGWLFWSAVLAVVTTMAVLVVGLPLRLVPRLRSWWSCNGEYTLLGGGLGVLLIAGSFLAGHPDTVTMDGVDLPVFQPQGGLLLAGWTALAFSCAHVRWPRTWTRAIRGRMDRGTSVASATGRAAQ